MRVYHISVWRVEKGSADHNALLCSADYLIDYNYFTKGKVQEFLTFTARTISGRIPLGQRHSAPSVEDGEDNLKNKSLKELKVKDVKWVHGYHRSEGVCGIVITDGEYDERIAHSFLSKTLDEFITKYPKTAIQSAKHKEQLRDANPLPLPALEQNLEKYQNPEEADSITKIQRELDDTKIVLHKTIEGVLERGEKIDNLVAKSEGLSASSKMFYTQAKKQNSCCIVM